MVRVRIAPSPTGFAHVGTAYTALFNFAFAKKNKGEFVLRLEDTDVKRNVKEAEGAIYEGLKWLGLTWNEGPDIGGELGPYRQSERLKTYKEWSKKLLGEGKAYEEDGAIRFKNTGKDMIWKDLVRGQISFLGGEVTDFVIIKSDGFPTYNFGVVVDDVLMKISHVIRGEEHISNTPRQLALYDAFGLTPPEFAHLPTLRNKERKKLSKRRDPVDLRIFRERYLPEALVNFLCLLGWSHPEGKEIFDIEDFIDNFDLSRVRKAGPIFELEKLDWINKQWQMKKTPNEFISYVSGASIYRNEPEFSKISGGTAEASAVRVSNIDEYDSFIRPYFEDVKVGENKKKFSKKYKDHLSSALQVLENLKKWKNVEIDTILQNEAKTQNFNIRDFFMDLRIALTGETVTLPSGILIENMDKDMVFQRLRKAIES